MSLMLNLRSVTPQAVAPSSTAFAQMPVGRRQHAHILVASDATRTPQQVINSMAEVRLLLNGNTRYRMTGPEWQMLNLFAGGVDPTNGSGSAGDPVTLILHHDWLHMITRAGEQLPALNTGVAGPGGQIIQTVAVEVDIDSAAVAPKYQFYSRESAPLLTDVDAAGNSIPAGPGTIKRIDRSNIPVSGAGETSFLNLPYGSVDKMGLARIHFLATGAAVIEAVRVLKNTNEVFNRTAGLNRAMLLNAGRRVPQSGWFHLDFLENGYSEDWLDLRDANSLEFSFTTSGGAGGITYLAEYIGNL